MAKRPETTTRGIKRPLKPRRRTAYSFLVAILGAAALLLVLGAAANAKTRSIDWEDPEQQVTFKGGWSAGVCGPNVPTICVTRHGEEVGVVEVGASPLDSTVDVEATTRGSDRYLAEIIADFTASVVEDRAEVCGSDYNVELEPLSRQRVMSARGVTFGFSGNFAGQPVSERAIISMVIIEGHLVSVNATAHDPTSCYSADAPFTTADLDDFEPHLRKLVRSMPPPTFLWAPRPTEARPAD